MDVKIGVDETTALVKAEVGDEEEEMLKERLEVLLSDFWTSAGANGTPPIHGEIVRTATLVHAAAKESVSVKDSRDARIKIGESGFANCA